MHKVHVCVYIYKIKREGRVGGFGAVECARFPSDGDVCGEGAKLTVERKCSNVSLFHFCY